MGLDQYLYKRTYIQHQSEYKTALRNIFVKKNGREIINPDKITYILEKVGYWRKANQIHNWFVNNCQDGVDDCRDAYVSIEQLKELLNICKTIQSTVILKKGEVQNGYIFTPESGQQANMEEGEFITNPEICESLLPTTTGFFFGSTDYDQYYMEDIDDTIKILEEALDGIDEDSYEINFIYSSSW